jgi:hypothetical protein
LKSSFTRLAIEQRSFLFAEGHGVIVHFNVLAHLQTRFVLDSIEDIRRIAILHDLFEFRRCLVVVDLVVVIGFDDVAESGLDASRDLSSTTRVELNEIVRLELKEKNSESYLGASAVSSDNVVLVVPDAAVSKN